jgi:uncharacterized protein (TIGR03086 family)
MAPESTDETAARYRRAADGFSRRVHGVPDGAWDRPAPCPGWVARDIVGHLVEWVPAFLDAADGPHLEVVPSVAEDPVRAWEALDVGLRGLVEEPAVAATSIHHPHAGTHRLDDAIGSFFLGDIVVHTWDLARATGQDEHLDPELVHDLLVGMEPMDEYLRVGGQYGPKVDVPAGSDEQTRLIAFTGRRP